MNRREVLTGMAVASASAAFTVPTLAIAPRASRAAWDRAMTALKRAKTAHDAFDARFWRIEDAYKSAVDALPHTTVEIYGRRVSTADRNEVAWARNDQKNLRYVEACAYEGVKARQQLADAADARDARIEAINKRLGRGVASNHFDALSEAICAAEEVLLDMPAPDGEAVLWKVARLYPEGEGIWAEGVEAQTHADLRRFLLSGQA